MPAVIAPSEAASTNGLPPQMKTWRGQPGYRRGDHGGIDAPPEVAWSPLLAAIEEASAREVARVFATNVFDLLTVTRAVLPPRPDEPSLFSGLDGLAR